MKKIFTDIKNHKFFTVFIMVFILIVLYKLIDYIPTVWSHFKNFTFNLLNISKPIIIAAVMSYILKPLVNLVDRLYFKLFYKIKKDQDPLQTISKKQFSKIRLLTVITVLLTLSSIIFVLILFILEPFLNSLKALIRELPAFVDLANKFLSNLELEPHIISEINQKVTYFLNTNLANLLNTSVSALTTFISNTGIFIFNFLIAVILSVYILRDKEKIARFFSVLIDIIFSKNVSDKIKSFSLDLDKIFGGYFTGVIVDAIFVGFCSFALTAIIKNPYAVIIGVLAGVSNVIPYVGPLIGAIGAFVLGLPSGFTVAILGFALLIIFQQVEGNLIQPKILGDFVGLPPLVVIISIIIGGGLFGVVGIIIASPVVGVVSLYYKRYLDKIDKEI